LQFAISYCRNCLVIIGGWMGYTALAMQESSNQITLYRNATLPKLLILDECKCIEHRSSLSFNNSCLHSKRETRKGLNLEGNQGDSDNDSAYQRLFRRESRTHEFTSGKR
jgi:hypothetical protein